MNELVKKKDRIQKDFDQESEKRKKFEKTIVDLRKELTELREWKESNQH